MSNLVRETFSYDSTWTAPAGVTQVTVRSIGIKQNVMWATNTPGPTYVALNSLCDAYAWGSNVCGTMGIGSITLACQPTLVCCGIKWRTLGSLAGTSTAIGLDTAGLAHAWGEAQFGVLGNNTTTVTCLPQPVCCDFVFKKIIGGDRAVYGITCSNDLYAWGRNADGQLGIGSTTNKCQPNLVLCGCKWRDIIPINEGADYVFGLTTAGTLMSWGSNCCGVLGVGSVTSQCTPQIVCCNLKIKSLIGGFGTGAMVAALGCDGNVYTWGSNTNGQLGIGSITQQCQPQPVVGGLKFTCIAMSSGTSCSMDVGVVALTAVGSCAYSWGTGICGQLGVGSITNMCCPTAVCCGFAFKEIFPGVINFYGITTAGVTYGWGLGRCGSGGTAVTTNACQPTAICSTVCFAKINQHIVASLGSAILATSAFGIARDGTLYGWGNNVCGALGINSITAQCCPVAVCCGFIFTYATPETKRSLKVIPGFTYAVSLSGAYQTFDNEIISNNPFTESLVIEYFQ